MPRRRRATPRSIGLGILVLFVFFTTELLAQSGPLPEKGICAHRGANRSHPENTLPAFREAIRLGAQMIEFDVYLSRDKQAVVIHDPTVDRTTDGTGRVSEKTLSELKRLDAGSWKDKRFRGTRIPTLAEVLQIMPNNIWLNVHLKGDATLAVLSAREIARQHRTHQAFLACRDLEALKAAKRAVPTIMTCHFINLKRPWKPDEVIGKCQFVQFGNGRPPADLVRSLRAAGIRTNYYGPITPEILADLYARRVQFPLVDDVQGMTKAVRKLGIEPVKPVWPGDPRVPPIEL
ncbi:MAG: hypothetical protein JW818_05175 [Pirellulales bacterium]|nr:hypothetical protein [Pirellulales bacterium]